MSNFNDHIELTENYINSMLDEKIHLQPIEKFLLAKLPVSLTSNFRFYSGQIINTKIIFAYIADGNSFSPAQIQKLLSLMEKKCGTQVIAILGNVASYNLQRLIAQKVNFIIPPKQMFIPSLLIDLRKQKLIDNDIATPMPAIAQCMLLFHIEIESLDGKQTQDIAKIFNVSYANANRAIRWLKAHNIITINDERTKEIVFEHGKKDTWEAALSFFKSPVEKTVYTDSQLEDAMESGINALSEYSMINREKRFCYAITKKAFKNIGSLINKEYGTNVVEVWRYDPRLLSKTETVDKLSLYLSLKDNEDERVQIELENLMNEIQW